MHSSRIICGRKGPAVKSRNADPCTSEPMPITGTDKLFYAALRMKQRFSIIGARLWGGPKTVYVWSRVPFYRQMWEAAATRLSAEFIELAEGVWEVRLGQSATFINNHKVQLDDAVIDSLCGNKPFCYDMLKRERIPIPDHVVFHHRDLDAAWQFLKGKTGLHVVKPALNTASAMGVTTHLGSVRECRMAIALASLYSPTIILEDLVSGECYRLLVLNGKMIHAVRRRGARVRGDGRSTIAELVKKENEQRSANRPSDHGGPITFNRDMAATLACQGYSPESVPRVGREVLVQSHDRAGARHAEVRTIYNEVVTDLICPELRHQAERAACILHSRFAGVDVITTDPSVPLEKSGGVISEINSNPGLHHHYLSSTHDTLDPADDLQATLAVLTSLLGDARLRDREEQSAPNRDCNVAAARPIAL